MARQFQMPENLDIGYKFFGGKFTMKEIAVRLLGLPPALVAGGLIYGITESKFITAIPVVLLLGFGYWVGAKKVFNNTVPLITAIQYANEQERKTKVLFNYRDYEDTTKPKAKSDKGGAR